MNLCLATNNGQGKVVPRLAGRASRPASILEIAGSQGRLPSHAASSHKQLEFVPTGFAGLSARLSKIEAVPGLVNMDSPKKLDS